MLKKILSTLMLTCLLSMTGCASMSSTFSSMSLPMTLPTFSFADDNGTIDETNTEVSEITSQVEDPQVDAEEELESNANKNGTYTFKFPHLIIR